MNTEITKTSLWFSCVNFPENCPSDCEKLIATPDTFATGDSPTAYECTALNVMDCPIYIEHEADNYSTDEYLGTPEE